MLGEELLGDLGKGGCALVCGPLSGGIGTMGNGAERFLSERTSLVRREGADLRRVNRRVGAVRPLPARYFTTKDIAPVV